MANNNMYLVNTRTGHRVKLAKYYPSTGWYVPYPRTLTSQLTMSFDDAGEPPELNHGTGEWVLEYEIEAPPEAQA